MSVSCQKDYQIKIAPVTPPTPTAYWKLDEALGSVNRVDSVGAADLQPLGVTAPGTPALINNGVVFSAAFGGADYTTFIGFPGTEYTAGNSFSLWGWFRVNAIGPGGGFGPARVSYLINVVDRIIFSVGNSLDPTPFHVESFFDTQYFLTSLAAWHLFHIFYDATVSQYGYSIDSGAEVYLPTVHITASDANATIELDTDWLGGVGQVIFDEIGLINNAKLTASEVNYLYNSGAGRTLPFT